jgi:hypothetical protein
MQNKNSINYTSLFFGADEEVLIDEIEDLEQVILHEDFLSDAFLVINLFN